VSPNRDIIDLIPLYVQGRLNAAEGRIVLEQIQQSPELQKELSLWKGIHSIRRELPRFEFSAHPLPEQLDRFAQGKINQLSNEYTEIRKHLQECSSCTDDVDQLRQVVKLIPEEHPRAHEEQSEWTRSIFGLRLPTIRALAPVFSFLVVMFAMFVIFQRTGEQGDIATVMLKPQYEKRSVTDSNNLPEMQVFLKQNTNEVIFTFSTDHLDIPDYQYVINLTPKSGTPIELSGASVSCQSTQLTNQCQLAVTDMNIIRQLKQGGSFTLSIREEFPVNVQLEPAQYEYYFKVSVK
jgi:hypothetical protein